MEKSWRPPEWDKVYADRHKIGLTRRCLFEAGASTIIPYVEVEVRRETAAEMIVGMECLFKDWPSFLAFVHSDEWQALRNEYLEVK